MKKGFCLSITIISLIVLLLNFSALAVPGLINYQGKLTDASGDPLNGLYNIRFAIYTAAIGGTCLWNEQKNDISLVDSILSVHLGSVTSFPAGLFDNDILYLEIAIENPDTSLYETLSPRQQLTSTPYSMKAADADTLNGLESGEFASTSHAHDGEDITSGIIDKTYIDHGITRDSELITHAADPSVHHSKTTSFSEMTDIATDDQIPDNITVNYSKDADKVDGKHASEFGDGHSLDAVDGSPGDAVYVDEKGNVGIGTTIPTFKLTVDAKNGSESAILGFHGGSGAGVCGSSNTGEGVHGSSTSGKGVYGSTTSGYAGYFEGKTVITNGSVGINTTTPNSTLEVIGTAKMGYLLVENGQAVTKLRRTGVNNISTVIFDDSKVGGGTAYFGRWNNDMENLRVYGGGSTRLLINLTSGNVGIGTTSPSEKLQITSGTTNFLIAPGELDNAVNSDWVTLDIPGTKNFRIWDNLSISGKVGIGTVSPNQELHIKGPSHTDVKIEAPYNYNAGIILNEASNLRWLLYNDADEGDRFRICNGPHDLVTVEQNGNVGIGTSNPSNKLDVLGTIRAVEVIVETGWADYVFEEDYIRMGLDELETYITQRGHLPGIPTEEEVKENGIGLGEFQVKLLQKIEELTLYLIDQKKEINRLQNEIAELKGLKSLI